MGRSEYLRKYDEVGREWRDLGFQVFALEWRGQGLSDRPLGNRQKCHIDDYTTHVGDLEAWLEAVVTPRSVGPRVIFGHSMGGLIALQVLLDRPDRFAAAVLTAPMVDINTAPWPKRLARLLAQAACTLGYGNAYVFGATDYHPAVEAAFEGNRVTADPERFRRIHDGYRSNPKLIVGGVTFGWLAASFRAQLALLRPQTLARISTPVLVLIAGEDRLIPRRALVRLGHELPAGKVAEYPEARHDLLAERDGIRDQVWRDIRNFLDQTLYNSGN